MGRLNIKALMRRHGLRPKRSWSQNFLVDEEVLFDVAAQARLAQDDVVVELGAGLGALTTLLAGQASQVVAVERDRELAQFLRSEFVNDDRVRIVEDNAARLDWPILVADLPKAAVVVGNLPYHIASQILFHLLAARKHLSRWLLMFQREMADRIVASPGSRTYGVIGILTQMHVDVQFALDVPPDAFYPAPKVHSSVLRFEPRDKPLVELADVTLFERLVKGVFQQRRKMLSNSLRSVFGKQLAAENLKAACEKAGVDSTTRPEQLSIPELGALSDALAGELNSPAS